MPRTTAASTSRSMAVPWNTWASIFWIGLGLIPTGVMLQQIQLEPLTTTVLQGSDVRFRATVQGAWTVMTWNVGGLLVLTILPGNNISSSPGQFSATYCSGGDTGCVDFAIHSVTRNESGQVVCTVQGQQGSKAAQLNVEANGTVAIRGGDITVDQDQPVEFQCVTAAWFPEPDITWSLNGQSAESSLYNTSSSVEGGSYNSTSVLRFQATRDTTVKCSATVQTLEEPQSSSVHLVVVPKPPDWTVLIAVVVSFGGCALLALLVIGIVFCYKRRKEKQPSYQKEMSRRVKTQGQENTGYVTDDQTSAAPTEPTDRGCYQANGSNTAEAGSASKAEDPSVFMKHRHATIV